MLYKQYCVGMHMLWAADNNDHCVLYCRDDGVVQGPADSVERWTHDLYVEEDQGPRTEEEKERVS